VEACEAWGEQGLGPGRRPGDLVLMDRRCRPTNPAVPAVLPGWGVEVRLLPAYSPDCNPIEKAWSKVKEAVRRARPRTAETLSDALGVALRAITPEDIRGWFTHWGYHTDS